MIDKKVGYFKYNKIIKEAENHIYHDKKTNMAYKLDKPSATEMKAHHKISVNTPEINTRQIEMLSAKNQLVDHTYLPCGLVHYDLFPVAIIYPYYFEGYQTFEELYKEDSDTILERVARAYFNNRELLENDIYNKDFAFKNIMYKGSDVELVDLDGHHIGNSSNSTYRQVYSYFYRSLLRCIRLKLELLYGEHNEELYEAAREMIARAIDEEEDIARPMQLLDEIQMKRILK